MRSGSRRLRPSKIMGVTIEPFTAAKSTVANSGHSVAMTRASAPSAASRAEPARLIFELTSSSGEFFHGLGIEGGDDCSFFHQRCHEINGHGAAHVVGVPA